MPYAWDFLNQFGYINFGAKLPCRGVPPPPGYALEALRPQAAAAAPSASIEGVSMDAEDLKEDGVPAADASEMEEKEKMEEDPPESNPPLDLRSGGSGAAALLSDVELIVIADDDPPEAGKGSLDSGLATVAPEPDVVASEPTSGPSPPNPGSQTIVVSCRCAPE